MSEDPFKPSLREFFRRPSAVAIGLLAAIFVGISLNAYNLHVSNLPTVKEIQTVVGIAASLETRGKAIVRTQNDDGWRYSLSIDPNDIGQCKDGEPIVVMRSNNSVRLPAAPCSPKAMADAS